MALTLLLVFAAVLVSVDEEVVTVGLTAVVDDIVEDVSAVAVSDLVAELQPAKAKPARRSVNKIECFIGGLSCAPTDRPLSTRFPRREDWFLRGENGRGANAASPRRATSSP